LKECNGDTNKAFRKCSFKYHPDKNINNKNAKDNQQKLLEIHEIYSKMEIFEI
jgi:DnaJ-class molecular chaperone